MIGLVLYQKRHGGMNLQYEIDVNPFTNKITLVAGNDNVAASYRNGWIHIAVTFSDSNATIYFNGNDVIDDHIDPIFQIVKTCGWGYLIIVIHVVG